MTSNNNHSASWSNLLTGQNGWRSLALSFGITLQGINMYITATILPTVVAEIGGLNLYAWNMTLYVVASIVASSLSGLILQSYGPRKSYAIASMLLLIGTLVASLAPSMWVMLLGRVIQGLGGGMLLALCYAMIMQLFAENMWPRAMALLSGMWGVATLIGPAVGGIFAEWNAWRWAFGGLIPLIGLYIVLTSLILPSQSIGQNSSVDGQAREKVALPLVQMLWLTLSVLYISVTSISDAVWINALGIFGAVVFIRLLMQREVVASVRLLPLDTFRPGTPLFSIFITLLLLIMAATSETFIPYLLQILHAQTPLWAGYIAILMAIGWAISEIYSARWEGIAVTRAISFGPVLALLGIIILSMLLPITSHGSDYMIVGISIALIMVGFGIGVGWPHLSTKVLQLTPAEDKNIAASAMTTIQMYGAALGTAIAGMIANIAGINDVDKISGAANTGFWLFMLFALFPLIAIYSARKAALAGPRYEVD